MIEKLPTAEVAQTGVDTLRYVENRAIYDKINEIIDFLGGEQPRILICPYCGSEEWKDVCSSTLMSGPRNYYTYTCKKCHKPTEVLRIKAPRDHKVYLGPEDEVK